MKQRLHTWKGKISILKEALAYAVEGFRIIPLQHGFRRDGSCGCSQPDCEGPWKHPLTPNGLADANNDSAIIRGWFAQWPNAVADVLYGEGHVLVEREGQVGTALWHHGTEEMMRYLGFKRVEHPCVWHVATEGACLC
jgi:hypothetical protein